MQTGVECAYTYFLSWDTVSSPHLKCLYTCIELVLCLKGLYTCTELTHSVQSGVECAYTCVELVYSTLSVAESLSVSRKLFPSIYFTPCPA